MISRIRLRYCYATMGIAVCVAEHPEDTINDAMPKFALCKLPWTNYSRVRPMLNG